MGEYAPLISGAFGLLGVVVGSLWAWYWGIQQQKTANTFMLHKEFCDKEMIEVRYRAGELIKKYPDKKLDYLYESLSTQETAPLWTLMEFYNRLWISLKHHRLQDSLVPELFGFIFVWWNVICFERQLEAVDWEEGKYLQLLGKWLEEHITSDDWQGWKERAKRLRARVRSLETLP
jgi:hypothetical protein